jgi:hypothetical protein
MQFFLRLYRPIQSLAAPMRVSVSLQLLRGFRTVGRTPWTGDQLVARPLPVHKHRQTLNIHAPSEIRTNGSSVRASEGSSCLRPLGYCDQVNMQNTAGKFVDNFNPKYCIMEEYFLSEIFFNFLSNEYGKIILYSL